MSHTQKITFFTLLSLLFTSTFRAQSFTLTFHEMDGLPNISEVIHGDFNGDGDIDYILTGNQSGRLFLAVGNGIGMPEIVEIPADFGVYNIAAGDLDADGNLDFVGSAPFEGVSYRWMNDGSGNFTREILLGFDYNTVHIADLNGNGDLEIVMHFNESLNVYTFNTSGGVVFLSTILTDSFIGSVGALSTVDYDNDGDLDVVAGYNLDGVNVFLQGFNFFFEQASLFDEFNLDHIYPADFNGDGNVDFVTQSDFGQSSSLFINEGSDQFSELSIPKMFGSNKHTFVGDLGSDGVMDIIHTDGSNPTNTGLSIFNYDVATGELVQTVIAEDHVDTEGGGIVDLNGDGTLDFFLYTNDFFDTGFAFYVGEAAGADNDQDGYDENEDCDDNNPDVNPGAQEVPYNGIDDDCNPDTLDDDIDQDGYVLADDCDDDNPAINPGAEEIAYNGIDDDCNAATFDDDLDQDGFVIEFDCDDTNPNIYPGAEEIANNDVDEDCDGMDLLSATHDLAGSMINIYPNPVVDVINIDYSSQFQYKASLIRLDGQVIYQATNVKMIPVRGLINGTYILKVNQLDGPSYIIEKIVVEH